MPFMVLLAAPFALFDALLPLWLRGIELDVYGEIGLVVLIGVSAKNAILIDLCSASGRAGLRGQRIGQSRADGLADRRRRARAARKPLIGHR